MANDEKRGRARPTVGSGAASESSCPPEPSLANSDSASAISHRAGDGKSLSTMFERFGRYRIVKEIAEGTMGAVFLAEDTILDREVALKIPKLDKQYGDDLRARFTREAKCAAALQHSNVCPIFDVGEVGDQPYLAMAYIDGRPLSEAAVDFIGNRRTVVSLIRDLARALEYAHKAGVLHRDLKPANVMIDRQDRPVLMDFGLACKLNGDMRLTQTGVMIGTPAYMSLEQACGDSDLIGPVSDVYSLGVIFYELLTGDLPFAADSHFDLMRKLLNEEPARPRDRLPEIDPELEAICLKMIAKQACDRYQSMQDVADALDQYLSRFGRSEPRAASPVSTLLPGSTPHAGSIRPGDSADSGNCSAAAASVRGGSTRGARSGWNFGNSRSRSIPRTWAALGVIALAAVIFVPGVWFAQLATSAPTRDEAPAVSGHDAMIAGDFSEAASPARTTSASNGSTLPVLAPTMLESAGPRRWIAGLILGQYKDPDFPTNPKAGSTYRAIEQELHTQAGFEPLEGLSLVNEHATTERTRDFLANLVERTKPGDTVLLMVEVFAMRVLPAENESETDAGVTERQLALALFDSSSEQPNSLLPVDELARALDKMNDRRILVLLDLEVPIFAVTPEELMQQSDGDDEFDGIVAPITFLPIKRQHDSLALVVSIAGNDPAPAKRGALMAAFYTILHDSSSSTLFDVVDTLPRRMFRPRLGDFSGEFRIEGDVEFAKRIRFARSSVFEKP